MKKNVIHQCCGFIVIYTLTVKPELDYKELISPADFHKIQNF